MVEIKFIEPDGVEKTVMVEAGTTLMRAAVDNGINGILGDCGGAAACATCHCYIDEAYLSRIEEPAEVERSMLDFAAAERLPNSRLGCQVEVTEELSGVVVRLPETQY